MSISLTTIASLKTALGTPGIVVILDRHDRLAHKLIRNPEMMRTMGAARKIKKVGSKDIIFLNEDGRDSYLSIPKSGEVIFDDNTFTIISDGGQKMTYRIENESASFPPSRLSENHPPLDEATIAKENDDMIAIIGEQEEIQKKRTEEHQSAYARLKALPPVRPNPEYQAFHERVKSLMLESLTATPVQTNEQLVDYIQSQLGDADYGDFKSAGHFTTTLRTGVAPYVQTDFERHALASEKRGTWKQVFAENEQGVFTPTTEIIVSSGGPAPAERFLIPLQEISDERVRANLIAHETYHLRTTLSREIKLAANKAALSRLNLSAGQNIAPLTLNGATYTRATVNTIDDASGTVSITATKHRARRQNIITMEIVTLEKAISTSGKKAA